MPLSALHIATQGLLSSPFLISVQGFYAPSGIDLDGRFPDMVRDFTRIDAMYPRQLNITMTADSAPGCRLVVVVG